MSTELVQVEGSRVILALGRFVLGVRGNDELMRLIGAAQLVSVRRTFRESGSPGGSWAPLAASTIARNPKKYGAGHKLLIDSGRLLNSITFETFAGGVTIGTNVNYAAAQQFGTLGKTIRVGRKKRKFQPAIAYKLNEVEGRDGTKYKVPAAVTRAEFQKGRRKGVKKSVRLPSYESLLPLSRNVDVKAHDRAGGLPPRPFLIFRPEDPQRIRRQVVAFVGRQRAAAGLDGKDGQ